jgi:hypothetical protein
MILKSEQKLKEASAIGGNYFNLHKIGANYWKADKIGKVRVETAVLAK